MTPATERLFTAKAEVASSTPAAANRPNAIALLTERDELRSLDSPAVYQHMRKPTLLFDGRNLLRNRHLEKLGFGYHATGSK